MAIWQYGLLVIPKKSILSKSGEIPQKLTCKVSPEKERYLPDTSIYWKDINLEINTLEKQIDRLVKKGGWSKPTFLAWKGNTELDEDNDCHIVIDETSNQIIEFRFRTDLRNIKNIDTFLVGMLKICDENEFILIDIEKNILEPKFEIIIEKIKQSRPMEFLEDPEKFLDKVIAENKKIR